MAKFKMLNPDKAEFVMSFTYTLGDWKDVCETLEDANGFPHSNIAGQIKEMVYEAEKTFMPKGE